MPQTDGPDLIRCQSSNVESFRWWDEQIWGKLGAANQDEDTLEVWFKATKRMYVSFLNAPSKGIWVWRVLRDGGIRYQEIT